MPIRPLDEYQIKDLAKNEWVDIDRGIDTYLICQRLDRIIALLERQSPTRDPATLPGYFNPSPDMLKDSLL